MQETDTQVNASASQRYTPLPIDTRVQVSDELIAGDILRGADAIAAFLFGEHSQRRRVYHLVDQGGLPVFRIGVTICARKSILLAWIGGQEIAATQAISDDVAQGR